MATSLAAGVVLELPLLLLSIGALALLVYESFSKQESSHVAGAFGMREVITLSAMFFALFALMSSADVASQSPTVFYGALYVDQFSFLVSLIILVGSIGAVLLGMARLGQEGISAKAEYYSLLLMSVVGALIFASAAELITLFLGLEIMSLALYCLCGAALAKDGPPMKRSSESALKYFILGSFSSAFMLYGIALLYGLSGSTHISVIAQMGMGAHPHLLLVAIGFVLVGMAFKIGAVPFHFWVPDVYQGAPTPVTAFMACVIKTAAVAAALRLFWVGFGQSFVFWSGAVWLVAVCTMVLGNLVALRQRSLKRMLAYSSIAHAGYMLVAFLVPGGQYGGGGAILYYLVVYAAMTMGAFGVLIAVTAEHNASPHPDDIGRFNGLGYRHPLLGILMALFMLSLAGIPPGLAGLMGKIFLFSAAIHAGFVGIAIIGVITSAISCYYYLRIIVAMYFLDAELDEEPERAHIGIPLGIVLGVCAVAVLLLGVFPDRLYNAAAMVVSSLH